MVLAKDFKEHAPRVVDEVSESLRDKDAIHVAGRRFLKILEVVVGKRLFKWNFDGDGGLVFVWNNFEWHK